jgi:prophage regulatory protein
MKTKRILRLPAVQDKTGLRRTCIYEGMAEGEFPKHIVLGKKAVGWLESEVDEWIDAQVAKRDGKDALKG